MQQVIIPRRVSTALINSLSAGVVPRVGLEFIAVGRKNEVSALLTDLENVAEGGASFRLIVGRYGSGKSFMLQLLRNYAMDRGFVVADADLSPERRLSGTNGQGLGTYRELMRNLSSKTRPDGGALAPTLEKWISGIQAQVVKDESIRPNDEGFDETVELRIFEVVNSIEGMVHGFDFANVLSAYWRGYRRNDVNLRDASLRWLRGEYATKTEARAALDVRVIVDDESWYDYLKLLSKFVSSIGYKGILVLLDEAVNLYKISHTVTRQSNYEKLLSMFNDTMQGKAENLAIIVSGTPQFVEDQRRGLYSYEALRSRLAESRFIKEGLADTSGPTIRLQTLTPEEIYVLLTRLNDVYCVHYGYDSKLTPADMQDFMQEVLNRLGAADLLTPREVVRDFLTVLNLLRQNPSVTFGQLVHGSDFQPTKGGDDPDIQGNGEFAEFSL